MSGSPELAGMLDTIRDKPFMIAIIAGSLAQAVKVLTFLLIEKRVNYKRFVQTDGNPNMHSAAMAALTLAVGLHEGFVSPVFALSLCMSILIMIDIMNVKNAASQQAEVIHLVLERIRKIKVSKKHPGSEEEFADIHNYDVPYSIIDVLTGTALGIVITLVFY
jgi:acid phosphatase family membrane protein YuiD